MLDSKKEKRRKFEEWCASLPKLEPCEFCGRILLAGMCCEAMRESLEKKMKVFHQKPSEPSLPWRKKPELKVPGNNVLAEWYDDNEVKFSDLTDDQKAKFLKDEATFKYDGDGLIVLQSKELVDKYNYSNELKEYELEQARYYDELAKYKIKLAEWEKEQREKEIADIEKQILTYQNGELQKRLEELKNGS